MADLTLYFAFAPEAGADADELARKLQSKLHGQDGVEGIDAKNTATPSRVTGLEILAAITLAAQVAHNAKDISDDLEAICENLKKLFASIRGVATEVGAKSVDIPVDGERKSIFALTDEDYHAIAEDAAAR